MIGLEGVLSVSEKIEEAKKLKVVLLDWEFDLIFFADANKQAEFVDSVLNQGEKGLHHDSRDRLYKAIINNIGNTDRERFKRFKEFSPKNDCTTDYLKIAWHQWIPTFKYFLGRDLGHDPSHGEMLIKMQGLHLWDFYRAFYALKYPEKVNHNPSAMYVCNASAAA